MFVVLLTSLSFRLLTVSESTYNALISACARKGDVDRAEFWLKKLLKSNAQADVASYSSVIHACAKANSLRRAEAPRLGKTPYRCHES